jgi:hypothetical protein
VAYSGLDPGCVQARPSWNTLLHLQLTCVLDTLIVHSGAPLDPRHRAGTRASLVCQADNGHEGFRGTDAWPSGCTRQAGIHVVVHYTGSLVRIILCESLLCPAAVGAEAIISALDMAMYDGRFWSQADEILRLVYAALDSLLSVWPCDCKSASASRHALGTLRSGRIMLG